MNKQVEVESYFVVSKILQADACFFMNLDIMFVWQCNTGTLSLIDSSDRECKKQTEEAVMISKLEYFHCTK